MSSNATRKEKLYTVFSEYKHISKSTYRVAIRSGFSYQNVAPRKKYVRVIQESSICLISVRWNADRRSI